MSQLGYSILFAVVPTLISVVTSLFQQKVGKAITMLILGTGVSTLVNALVIGGFTPNFQVFPFDAWFVMFLLSFIVVVVVDFAVGVVSDSITSTAILAASTITWVVIWMGFGLIFNPQAPFESRPLLCGTGYDFRNSLLANRLPITEDDSYQFSLPLELLPTKGQREAFYNAAERMPADLQTWLEPDYGPQTPYLEKIGDGYYWHVELKPRALNGEASLEGASYNTFMQKGGHVPGFMLVDALDRNKSPEMVWYQQGNVTTAAQRAFNTKLRYVFGIRPGSEQNVTAHLYYNYALPNSVIVDDPGIEYLDTGEVVYTAAALGTYESQINDLRVNSVILMNPETGEIRSVGMDSVPTSVDRIFSEEYVRKSAEYWGAFSVATWCQSVNNLDKKLAVDRLNYVMTRDGMRYQVTFTAQGRGTQIAAIWYVDPRSGAVIKVIPDPATPLSTIDEVDKMVTAKARTTPGYSPTAEAENCIIADILGEKTIYCLVMAPDPSNPDRLRNVGFAFFRARFQNSDLSKVVLGQSLTQAYGGLQQQIAEDAKGRPDMSQSIDVDIYTGIVNRIGTGSGEYVFTLNEYPNVVFHAAATNTSSANVLALTLPGDKITVSGLKGSNVNDINVGSVCNPKVVACE